MPHRTLLTLCTMRASILSQVFLAPYTPTSSHSHLHPLDKVYLKCNTSASESSVRISSNWHVLGPFQIGTREAEWSADPLRYHGGFQHLAHSNALFKSSLALNGTVGWSTAHFKPNSSLGSGILEISFNSSVVDWDFLRSTYGWSGIQYQAWARGTLLVCPGSSPSVALPHEDAPGAIPVTLHISPTLEYFVNKKPYFGGDMFSYKRVPSVLQLTPGVPHTLDIRITHDIRAFGGAMPPALEIAIEADLAKGGLQVEPDRAIVPDVVDGMLAGRGWVSIPVRNERAVGWIEIVGVLAEENGSTSPTIHFNEANKALFQLAPGQSRPLKVRITDFPANATSIALLIQYRVRGSGSGIEHLSTSLILPTTKSIYSPHIFTYLHPSGIVSYATLRPPSFNATCNSSPAEPPILLSLHGAGVDVHSCSAQNVYAKLPNLCAWLLIPQGVTLWGGDDWHIWGWAEVEAAIASIPDWIETTGWKGQNVNLDKWVVSGHSNGGQGTWYALTHKSDKIIAGTPLSGYLSIPAYVPYHMWHEADPKKSGLILAAMNSYRHELLVDNYVGTPILQGHGQLDDNVPTFHSRKMRLLSHEAGWDTEYIEFPGRGHWWEGVMADGTLPAFLNHYINEHPEIPPLPSKFSIVVANPADMSSRGGVIVEQLEVYDQLGKINIDRTDTSTWVVKTNNIRRLRIGIYRPGLALPTNILLDAQSFRILGTDDMFVKSASGEWKRVHNQFWRRKERSGKQLGALDAFLNTSGHFTIVLPPAFRRQPYHQELAIEISRNLYQYYSADSDIVQNIRDMTGEGNVIFIDIKDTNIFGPLATEMCLDINEEIIAVQDATGRRKIYPMEPGVGVIFLRPLGLDRLGIVVTGADEDGVRSAARLVPLRTGVGQPNFIILGKEAGWKGVEGALAMGMFDSKWQLPTGFL